MNQIEKKLMALDSQFCEDSKILKEKGWEKYLDKHALMGTGLHEPYIEGRQKISKIIEIVYALNNIDFTWTPVHAFVSEDETLGVTTGTYKRTYTFNDEEKEDIGKYMTVWKKVEDTYKIVFDMGN